MNTERNTDRQPAARIAAEAPKRAKASNYPEPFASLMRKREKRPLGDLFGLTTFGVNLNRTADDVVFLEVGDRTPGDSATYPDDDIQASLGADVKWRFLHKDGTPY